MGSTERPSDEGPTAAVTVDFSRTAQAVFSAASVEDTLARVLSLAVATIEGCDFAGVVLVEGDSLTTPIRTDPVVADLDALQHRTSEGPWIDAVAQGMTVYADDLADDARWPRFGPDATARGMRSLLALPLFANGPLGALNLYAGYPQAFGIVDRGRGLLLAGLAGMALSTAQSHEDEERRAVNLRAALATREVIGQAQGILIERERITASQAFDVLRRASQHLNVKLREVAETLVETGESPETGLSPLR